MMWKRRYPIDLTAIPTVDDTAHFEAIYDQRGGYLIMIAVTKVVGDSPAQAIYQAEYEAWQAEHAHVLGSVGYQKFVSEKEEAAGKSSAIMVHLRELARRENANREKHER